VARVALEIREAAAAWSVDPYLVAAIAVRESGLQGRARSQSCRGIMQLHERSRHGIEAARRCRAEPERCTAIEIDVATEHLARSIAICGDEASALGRYHRGRCGADDYARSVLRLRDELRGAP
jgi:soluble lytic murein transglycosylase-like protein